MPCGLRKQDIPMDKNKSMNAFDRQEQQPEFWDGQGCAFCESEQFEAAVTAFDQAIAIDVNYCKAWNNRGNALCGMKRYAEALASYDRAIALQPNYHQAWFNRGLLLTEMMAYGNALESYDRSIAINPDPRYLHAREEIWMKQKMFA